VRKILIMVAVLCLPLLAACDGGSTHHHVVHHHVVHHHTVVHHVYKTKRK
jgi:hypothetical protein